MKTVWKIIGCIGIIALTLGVICIVVGLITGGSINRIIDTIFSTYDIDRYLLMWQQLVTKGSELIFSIF